MGKFVTYIGGAARNTKRKLSSVFMPALGTLGQDALHTGTPVIAKRPKAPKKVSVKKFKSATPPSRSLMTPFEASPGATGPALGSVTAREGPATFFDDLMPWSDAVDEGVGGSGTAGADSAASYAETAVGLSGAGQESIPAGSYADDTSLSGPMAELFAELKAGAAELGISLEQYGDRLLSEYPWLAATLGVASGAALVAMLYSLMAGGAATGKTTTTTKKVTAKSKAAKKPSYMTIAEHDAWKATRGKSGSISRKEFHDNVWNPPKAAPAPKKRAVGRTGTKPAGHPKTGTKKLVKFKDKKTGKMVSFYART